MSDTSSVDLAFLKREFLRRKLAESAVPQQRPADEPPIPAVARDAALPLSWAQRRLWFLDQLDHAAGAAYHIPAALLLEGELDVVALRATLDRLVARHEVLRTRFGMQDGEPVQLIDAPGRFALVEHDLSALPAQQQDEALARLRADEAAAPFELARGPLIRGRLVRLAAGRHVLLVTQHHIVSDGWSIGIVLREVSALYSAFSQGRDDPLPPLPLQYADYAAWQRGWLQGVALQRQVGYWRERLAGAPALLELPTDRPRPPVQSYAGGAVVVPLSGQLSGALRALSQRHGVTLFMTLLAGWAVLLSRLSGQSDVVVGTPVANRRRGEIENVVGCFVNTLALRVDLEQDPAVAALLAQVRADTLQAYAHQDLPFEQVVEALKPARSMAYSPVFQSMLSLNNTPRSAFTLPGLTMTGIGAAQRTTQFDLSLALQDGGPVLQCAFEYATDLFDESTVRRWAGHLLVLLEQMALDDGRPVSMLPLLDDGQAEALLARARPPAPSSEPPAMAHRLFERQAAARPEAPALACDGRVLSYGDLNRRANRVAHRLMGMGIGPDCLVGLCLERGVDVMVGMLGIMKAGAAYVPLDSAYPRERLAYMVDDCRPAALLTTSGLAGLFGAAGVPLLLADRPDTFADQPEDDPDARRMGLSARSLAYVIYTSGSTGRPKGVMVEHANLAHLVRAHVRLCGLDARDRVLQFAPYSFDSSVAEIFPAWSVGALLVLRPEHLRTPEAEFAAFLRTWRISVTDLPTAFWHQWAQSLPSCPVNDDLRLVMVGGEKAERAHLRRWFADAATPKVRWLNFYGPTEATVNAAVMECGADWDGADIPVGRPIPDAALYILDRHGRPVPPGVCGEIHIGGAGIARGYLNRPELTEERFVADAFDGRPGARMYRTGDLGRCLTDGTVEYLGRRDFQIKLRGFRIELGELEARLRACDGVAEALAVAREDKPGDKRVVAYVVARPGHALQAARLRRDLAAVLPDYMLPAAVVQLASIPLTRNGKVDRNALPAPGLDALATAGYEAPQGTVEIALARIWQELLGVPRVGRRDDFFELGGHSLLATQLVARVRDAMRVELKLMSVFQHSTLAASAARIAHAAPPAEDDAITPQRRDGIVPLAPAQQRLWFLDRLDPANAAAYHMPAGLRLRGRLETRALEAALAAVVERHEILRTRFPEQDGNPVQVIEAPGAFALARDDLEALPAAAREAALEAIVKAEFGQPFDLARGPLLRARLVRLGGQEHVLLLNQHHIISDGWSVGVLLAEVTALYAARVDGRPDPLAPLPIQYADYALWQRGRLQGERLERQLGYWREALRGAPALLELPTDRPRAAQRSHAGASVTRRIPAAVRARLQALGRRHGATPFMTMLAGWALLLARLSGQDDVVVGTPVANRGRRELEPLLGFFVNTLALRVRLEEGLTVAGLIGQVRAGTLAAYAHQDLPFEQVVEAVAPARSTAHSPLFQVALALDNTPRTAAGLPGIDVSAIDAGAPAAKFDLMLSLSESGPDLVAHLTYASALFDPATMARWLGHYETLLAAMADDDTRPVQCVPLLREDERAHLLYGVNRTAADHPRGELIHQMVERHAAARPHAPALVVDGERLGYGELNRRANQVAHWLLARGVAPEQRVALCTERGIDMVVGLLGILKAGAAYVPLDPDYPVDRLAWTLADSAPAALLTQDALAARLPAVAGHVLALDGDRAQLAALPDADPALRLHAGGVAYVIYTSGSTGRPKGVMNLHEGLCNLVRSNCTALRIGADSKILQFASCGFDASLWEIGLAWCAGATLYLAPRSAVMPGKPLLDTLARHPVTHLFLPPAALAVLPPDADLGSVHTVISGGEALPAALARHWAGRVALFNAYGPTEAAVCTTLHACDGADAAVPIGRPIANAAVYILDGRMQPAPVGVAGEIHIGGAGVARGYLNRPALSAERFVPDPFGDRPGARLYKTGDLGRRRADGVIEYVGRNDFQVKLRGFRIEPGEIEARLRACDGVREALVVARADGAGDKRLVAYLVGAQDAWPVPALRRHLALELPDYMVPATFVWLDALPLTPNGKVDRDGLPAPRQAPRAPGQDAPQGEVETVLAAIWQELLDVPAVGRHDDFFESGGHSLLALRLSAMVRARLGVDLPLRQVFAEPRLDHLAASLQRPGAAASRLVSMRPHGTLAPLFLMHGGDGEVNYAHGLLAGLDPDLPVYGIAAGGHGEGEALPGAIPELAREYAAIVRARQPRGPYRLCGWSAGGTIAVALAEHLRADGEEVEFVGMIDTVLDYGPGPDGRDGAGACGAAGELLHWLAARAPAPAALERLAALAARGEVDAMLAYATDHGLLPAGLEQRWLRRHVALRAALLAALRAYRVPPIGAPLHLFGATEPALADPTHGWAALAGRWLHYVPVGGTHYTMTGAPHAARLGAAIGRALGAARAARHTH